MKKAIALLAAFTLILCSCAKNGGNYVPDSEPYPEEVGESSISETAATALPDETDSGKPSSLNDLYKIVDLNILDFNGESSDETLEDIRNKYPDKTVLVWQLDPLITPPSSEAVNEYLDTLGKNYAVYFRDAPEKYRKSRFTDALTYSTYNETVVERLKNGEQIDIIDAFSIYNELSLHGYLEPIDPYLSDTAVGRELYGLMPENYWKGCRINGNIYGVCSYLTLGKRNGYLVNSALADKYGYDVEKPILEQIDILEQVKTEPCDAVMTWKGFSRPSECTANICFNDCIIWDDTEKTAKSILSDEAYTDALRTYFELYKEGFVTETPIKNSYFIYEQNSQYPANAAGSVDQLYIQIGNSVTAVPSYTASEYGTCIKPCNIGICIAAGSRNKDCAFDLIATAFTDAHLNNMLCYGKNYREYEQSGSIFLAGDDICRAWVFLNPMISIPPLTEPTDMLKRWTEGAESAVVSEDIDFVLDISGLGEIPDAVRAVTVEMSRKIFDGGFESFEDYLDEYSKRLDEAGQQVMIDEANRQYASYLENKNA